MMIRCSLCVLHQWSHKKQKREVNDQLIRELSTLSPEQVLEAIQDLQKPRLFIRGTCGHKLSLKATLITLDTKEPHSVDALPNSGCEGSCIDVKYIQEHLIPTIRLP